MNNMLTSRHSAATALTLLCTLGAISHVRAAWNGTSKSFDAADVGKCCGYSNEQIGDCVEQGSRSTRLICLKEYGQPGYPTYTKIDQTYSPGTPEERDVYQCCTGAIAGCAGKNEGDTCLEYTQYDVRGNIKYQGGTGKCVANRVYRDCVDTKVEKGTPKGTASSSCHGSFGHHGVLTCNGAVRIVDGKKESGMTGLPNYAWGPIVVFASVVSMVVFYRRRQMSRSQRGVHGGLPSSMTGPGGAVPAMTSAPASSALGTAGNQFGPGLSNAPYGNAPAYVPAYVPAQAPSADVAANEGQDKFCTNCGAQSRGNFCGKCGAAIGA